MAADDLLSQQLAYYRARAGEYDQWWLRQGRYDRGPGLNARWFAEAGELESALEAFGPSGAILELAGGTGIWTEKLLPHAGRLDVLDGSPEVLAINRARVGSDKVRHIEADLFDWKPGERYDTLFFSFWLSHVPPERFEAFWQLAAACLAPGGRVFFIDSRRDPGSTAMDHRLPEVESVVSRRRLDDGREFDIYKVFHDAAELEEKLRALGWEFEIRETDRYFLHGAGRPSEDRG